MNKKDKKRAEKKKAAKKTAVTSTRRKKAEDKIYPPLDVREVDGPRLPVNLPNPEDLPTREQLANIMPDVSPGMADLIEAIRTGRYDPQKHLQAVIDKNKKMAEAREVEKEIYRSIKDTPAEPWTGSSTPWKPLMWLQADTWDDFNLFPELPAMKHDGTCNFDEWKEHTVRCPGTRFFYANKTLPVSYHLPTHLHRKAEGKVFFDGSVTMPVLFEQTGEDEDYRQKVWMGLTPMEMLTQKKGIDMAKGRVVVGGLGLGWFLKEVAAKPEVREIVVVDRVPELLEWLKPILCEKFPDVARKVKEWLPGNVYEYMMWDMRMRGFGTVQWDLQGGTQYLLDIWPAFGDADYDKNFVVFEQNLGKEQLWGWGRGASYGGEVPEINPHERLPYERAYMRKSPCTGCPFSRTGDPTKDGHADPMALIGQAQGPFLLPCHQEPSYFEERQGEIYKKAQCAGAATYRSNLGIGDLFPKSFHILPEDHDKVFSKPAELLAYYEKITLDEAQERLKERTPEQLLRQELAKNEVRVYGYKS